METKLILPSQNLLCPDNVRIEIHDIKTKKLLDTITTHNLIVLAGRNLLRDFLYDGATPTVDGLTHFAVGTGVTAATANDTTLGTEVFRDTITQKIKDAAKLTVKYYLASGSANGSTLTEAGIFNASAVGTMYARVTHTGIAKDATISITYSWDLTWGV